MIAAVSPADINYEETLSTLRSHWRYLFTFFITRTESRCCVFSFFFNFQRLISEHTERISTKLGHKFTCDCYLTNLVRTPPGILPTGWGKTAIWTDFELWPNIYLCNRTWYQQSERNLSIYRDSPTCRQIWWTLVQKRLRTLGEFLIPLNFCTGRHCQPYRMDVI